MGPERNVDILIRASYATDYLMGSVPSQVRGILFVIHMLAVLDKSIRNHGRPASIMTGQGSQFYANKMDLNGDSGAPARRDTAQTAPVRGDNDGKE